MYKLRHYIADHLKIFKDLLADANFERHFGALKGEEHKRLPKELKEVGDKQPLIYKKQLYYMTQKDASLLTSPNLMEICLKHYHAGLPLQDFLSRALA
ncbi:MAG: DUF2461 family protein [Owenweeksia sp.]|nr:DUF2461 family protein [Owenweeksia sp.]